MTELEELMSELTPEQIELLAQKVVDDLDDIAAIERATPANASRRDLLALRIARVALRSIEHPSEIGESVLEDVLRRILGKGGAIANAGDTLKQAAKDIFITPKGAQNQAIALGFATMRDMILSEINLLRAATVPPLAARTLTQFNNTFKSTYEAKIDNLT